MKTLVVYDSVHGNTKIIAQSIGDAIPGEVQVLRASQVNVSELATTNLLVIGSPVHGGSPTEAMQSLLDRIGAPTRQGAKVATFDTRFSWWWIKIFGFAAPKMADALTKKGWTLIGAPEGFFVKGRRGPLKEGEIERAGAWAKGILESIS
jgi:flavodoxin